MWAAPLPAPRSTLFFPESLAAGGGHVTVHTVAEQQTHGEALGRKAFALFTKGNRETENFILLISTPDTGSTSEALEEVTRIGRSQGNCRLVVNNAVKGGKQSWQLTGPTSLFV